MSAAVSPIYTTLLNRRRMKNRMNFRSCSLRQFLPQARRRRKGLNYRRFSFSMPRRLLPNQERNFMSARREKRRQLRPESPR